MEVEQKRRGPKAKHVDPKEFHLKFSGEMRKHIEAMAGNNYQAYFDELVKQDIERKRRNNNA